MTPERMIGQGERLARMETILERVEIKVDRMDQKVDRDVADLAALKNKGAGMLIGVGLAGGAVGASLSKLWTALIGS